MGIRSALGLKQARLPLWRRSQKFGVLHFGYENFSPLNQSLRDYGAYDVNLGDNAQSIAGRLLFNELNIDDDRIISVNRDTLPAYAGPPCSLLMNAVFFKWCFPLPPAIRPIFAGFQASENVIRENIAIFKLHEPIGCRDTATTEIMLAHGIRAFTTGCVTLALPRRDQTPAEHKLLIVYGKDFPSQVLRCIPPKLLDNCELIYHRFPVSEHPLSPKSCLAVEAYEKSLLDRYRRTATVVLTSLHHVAAPCLAMGIPVIVCRKQIDKRFSFLRELIPIYTPEQFESIDWRPSQVDVSRVRENFKTVLADAVRETEGV